MYHDGSAVLEKALNLVQGSRGQRLKESQAEGLRYGGVDSIEDDICARALHPGGPALGIETMAGFGELQARLPFGTLESPGKIEIGKHHGRVTVHRSKRLCNAEATTGVRFPDLGGEAMIHRRPIATAGVVSVGEQRFTISHIGRPAVKFRFPYKSLKVGWLRVPACAVWHVNCLCRVHQYIV